MGSKCPECRETLAESRDYCELCGWHSYQDEDVRDIGQTLDAAVELTTRQYRALSEKDARIAALTEELERVKGRIQETIDYVKTGIHCRMVDHKYNDSCDCGPITDEFAKILKEPT